jgi:FkbM family methyltransferase
MTDPDQVAELDGFIRLCRPGMVLFDIGAHFGLFSLAALHYGGQTARAVAVDPSPTAERILQIQSRLNSSHDRLTILRVSVSQTVGLQQLVAAGAIANGYFVPPAPQHGASDLTLTPATTIDQLSTDAHTRPTHVKIDVEGLEAEVLRGGHKVFADDDAPLMFIELHNSMVANRGGDPAAALRLLRDYRYRVCQPDGTELQDEEVLSCDLIRVFCCKRTAEAR